MLRRASARDGVALAPGGRLVGSRLADAARDQLRVSAQPGRRRWVALGWRPAPLDERHSYDFKAQTERPAEVRESSQS